jgi:hypothetical protein
MVPSNTLEISRSAIGSQYLHMYPQDKVCLQLEASVLQAKKLPVAHGVLVHVNKFSFFSIVL